MAYSAYSVAFDLRDPRGTDTHGEGQAKAAPTPVEADSAADQTGRRYGLGDSERAAHGRHDKLDGSAHETEDGLMTLDKIRETYYLYSGKASDNARQLAFAGIALVWVFKKDNGGSFTLAGELLVAATLLVLVLMLDFLQYAVASVVFGVKGRTEEKAGKQPHDEVELSRYANWPTNAFFWSKLAVLALAYFVLLVACVIRLG